MLQVLNEDVLKLISTRDHNTWFSFVQTCTYFQRFNDQEELKQKFLIKVENIEGWKVQSIDYLTENFIIIVNTFNYFR